MKTKFAVHVLFLAAVSVAGVTVLKAQPVMGSMTNGLVGYFPMHGDATEATGHGMTGTLMGSPQWPPTGLASPCRRWLLTAAWMA